NHEFLADEKVVQSYQNIPFYQSLLLSKASCNPPLYLASNLNFQVTKKRFLMMSRNSSKRIMLGKKLALLPIFTVLFCYFCLDIVAQHQPKNNKQKEQKSVAKNNTTTATNPSTAASSKKSKQLSSHPTVLKTAKSTIRNIAQVTEKPEFPGGMEKFYQFVGENYKAPKDFRGNGKIYLMFIIEKDGSISNARTLRDPGFGTGEEALRVIKLSPKWIPAKKEGVPVRVEYSLPITVREE
ncbi:MAG: energy transducer TonB, partial [Flavobacterium sp.]